MSECKHCGVCSECDDDRLIFDGVTLEPCSGCSDGRTLEEIEAELGGYRTSAHEAFERAEIKKHNERIAQVEVRQ